MPLSFLEQTIVIPWQQNMTLSQHKWAHTYLYKFVIKNSTIECKVCNKKQLANIERHLTSDGIIFISGFGHKHKVTSKIKKEDLIQPNDFEDMSKSFELVKYYRIRS